MEEKKTNKNLISKQEKIKYWLDLVRFAFISLIIILPIRMYIIQPFVVSGESMIPTFKDKDYLIVDEITYRFKTPQRGDVIIFHPPNQSKDIYYIKRVVGLPGEKVILQGTKVIIVNDENPKGIELDEPYISTVTSDDMEIKVSDKEVFVLGDNRPRSSDSRVWGTLPLKNIKGRALVRLFPFDKISILPGFYKQK
jgi:signal peptidase I